MTKGIGLSKHQKSIIDIIQKNGDIGEKHGENIAYIKYDDLYKEMMRRYHVKRRWFKQGHYSARKTWQQTDEGRKYMVFSASFSRTMKRLLARDIIYISANGKVCVWFT